MIGRCCLVAAADSAGVPQARHSTGPSREQAAPSWSGKEAVGTKVKRTSRVLVSMDEVDCLELEVAKKVDWEGAVAWRRTEAR